jgi:hypothetical protein
MITVSIENSAEPLGSPPAEFRMNGLGAGDTVFGRQCHPAAAKFLKIPSAALVMFGAPDAATLLVLGALNVRLFAGTDPTVASCARFQAIHMRLAAL